MWAYEIRIYPYKVPPELNMPPLVNKNELYKILLDIKWQLLTECFRCFKVAIINLGLKSRKQQQNGENGEIEKYEKDTVYSTRTLEETRDALKISS
jgi:hypothetical protein